MKKIITFFTLITSVLGNTQCPAPSNITVIDNINLLSTAELSWTEDGNATAWDIALVPDFNVGTSLPSIPWVHTTRNPIILTNIPSSHGCYAFFVRSVCSNSDVSPWAAVASSGCPIDIVDHLSTLSVNSFTSDDNNIKIFPNPSKNIIQIKSVSIIDKVTVFDALGKSLIYQTQNNSEINIENLSNGIYLIEISTQNEKIYRKFIKE